MREMATAVGCHAFSQDGQYYSCCGNDGKLRIWETVSGRLKHEYTPNQHLLSPCSVLDWISVNVQPIDRTSPSPWKRCRRKSTSEEVDQKVVAMGLTNGSVILYNIATASITVLKNDHAVAVTALAWSAWYGLITATDDYHIVEWNLQENGIKCKWKSGKIKITALAILTDGKSMVSAERIIKWWDLTTKQLIRTFTGHANPISSLHTVKLDNTTSYLISSAHADGYLSVWLLDKNKNDKVSLATLAMQDEATSISTLVQESQLIVSAITRSGQAQLFKYQSNGRTKPLKPSLSIAIASDVNQKDPVQQIPILAGQLTENGKLLLAYDSLSSLTFEKIVPDFSDKVQCFVRSEKMDLIKWKDKKAEVAYKIKASEIEGDIEYLAPGIGVMTTKRNRTFSGGSQSFLKDRLENLSLNADANSPGKTSTKGVNLAQLLMQALNSKDKAILTTVLFTKNKTIMHNTIAKLPVQAITPLLKELTIMLQGKMHPSKIATMWLQALITTHAAHLLSRPDIAETLTPILNLIDGKLMLLTDMLKLKGRISLIMGQISHASEKHKDITEESLLVYQDPDSSDETPNMDDTDSSSESDDNWEEISEQDVQNEQDEDHIKSIESEDNGDDSNSDSICT